VPKANGVPPGSSATGEVAVAELQAEGVQYRLDQYGFLADPTTWDTRFAEAMARQVGIAGGLSLPHWKVVLFVRKYLVGRGEVARLHETCRHCGLTRRRLRHLFPAGYLRGVCRIAGVPYEAIAESHYALTYEVVPAADAVYPTSTAGFLCDPEEWDPGFPVQAEAAPATLTPLHWAVIDEVRLAFQATGHAPTIVDTCRHTGITLAELRRLFPQGFRQGVLRLAGLPVTAC
jgi:TusE/DsrC/DsvC family sulfur relay protein